MFDNLHPPPPALVAALNWCLINRAMFAVPPAAPSPAYLAAPAGSPWAGASPGWEGLGGDVGRGTSSPTTRTRSSGRSQTPQGNGGEEEAAFKGFRKPELGLEQQVGIFYR